MAARPRRAEETASRRADSGGGGRTPRARPASLVAVALVPLPLVQAAWWAAPALRATPLAMAEEGGPLLAVCPRARERGLAPGQSRTQARLRCPAVRVVSPDRDAAAALWEETLAALCAVSPRVEATDPAHGLAYLDAGGLERVWGDAAAVARAALRALEEGGVQAWAGAGPTRLAARALALQRAPGAPRALAADEAARLVAALPIGSPALDLPPPLVSQLRDLGVRTAGALARLPETGVGLRFGAEGVAAWRAISGAREPPLRPWTPPPTLAVTHCDEEGIGDALLLDRAVATLAAQLADHLTARGQAATQLTLRLTQTDGARRVAHAQRPEPLQAARVIGAVATDLLAGLHVTAPVAEATLTAAGLGAPTARQEGLWAATPAATPQARLHAALEAHRRQYGRPAIGRMRRDPEAPEGWRWEIMERGP